MTKSKDIATEIQTSSHSQLAAASVTRYGVKVTATGPFGETPPNEFTIDLADIRDSLVESLGSLYGLSLAVADASLEITSAIRAHG